jgi:hypothetical protein
MQDVPKQNVGNRIDLWRRFRPTPSQEKFLRSQAFGRLFSSGYGSGKSSTGCREGIGWAVKYAGSRGLIGRQTATDLRDTTMVTFWKEMNHIGFVAGTPEQMKAGKAHYTHNKADREIVFWNGSSIIYRHLDDPDALGSLELNWAFIDEGAEVADLIYKTLASSRLRWHLPVCDQQERVEELISRFASDEEIAAVRCDCPRGIWVCTNPGASGYLKSVTRGEVDGWEWIPAKPGDNPYNGPDYYAKMERDRKVNGDIWMKRYYEGSWDAFEGQRFPMFDRDTHVLADSWKPTPRHVVVEGWDFGHRETFVAWMAYLPDGSEPVVVFHELQMNEVQEPKDVADEVKRIRLSYGLDTPIALGDPAGVAASTFSAVSPIMAYAGLGIHISPCKKGKSPTSRADLLTAFLNERKSMLDGTSWPGIVFAPNCLAVVDSIINLRWKPQTSKLGEDPREQFIKKDDHGFDALGYGLVGVPPPDLPKQRTPWKVAVNTTAQEAFRSSV